MNKSYCVLAAVLASAALTGCSTTPADTSRIHLITEQEAALHRCVYLDHAGSASAILIKGKTRNTGIILQKAKKVPGATHISYTKGEPGYAFTKANIWRCPNPHMITMDPETQKLAIEHIGHL